MEDAERPGTAQQDAPAEDVPKKKAFKLVRSLQTRAIEAIELCALLQVLPPFMTSPEDLASFGVEVCSLVVQASLRQRTSSRLPAGQVGDIVRTPLGLKGTVLGARRVCLPQACVAEQQDQAAAGAG